MLKDGVKVFGDCAINVAPTADELAQIAVASARTAATFGVEPRVAMLSYASGDSNKGALIDVDDRAEPNCALPSRCIVRHAEPSPERPRGVATTSPRNIDVLLRALGISSQNAQVVKDATARAKALASEDSFPIEGPIQFDAAVDPAVASIKYNGRVEMVSIGPGIAMSLKRTAPAFQRRKNHRRWSSSLRARSAQVQGPRVRGRGPRDGLRLSGFEQRQQRLQGRPAGVQDHRGGAHHAGPRHARQRPLARMYGGGHRQHRRHHGAAVHGC